jgi:hypothetical protein
MAGNALAFLSNLYLWMGLSIFFMVGFGILLIFLIMLAKKTHAIVEFRATMKGVPICLFFQDNRYCEWKPIKPDAGIIMDKEYGAYIINERATYVDRRTKNVLIPFDANIGASINVKAAKLIDDLQHIAKDEEQMRELRRAIALDQIDENESINVLKTSIHFGAIKNMMTAMIPHNISAKIEKVIAQRLKGYGAVNVPQIAFLFAAIFGAILLGALVIKLAFPKAGAGK